jgi:hypothetical protein
LAVFYPAEALSLSLGQAAVGWAVPVNSAPPPLLNLAAVVRLNV